MASPILVQDGNGKHRLFLTFEQLEILDALPDHGLHLGWFKNESQHLFASDAFSDSDLGSVDFPDGMNAGALAETAILPGFLRLQHSTAPSPDVSADTRVRRRFF